MRVEHTYELSSLAKSLKKQLGLTNFTNAQILEVLAKAANAPSYGHMKAAHKGDKSAPSGSKASKSKGLPIPVDSTYVKARAWSDDKAVDLEFDGRPFLLNEKAEVVLAAVLSEHFHGGRTEQTDEIASSRFVKANLLFDYLEMARLSPSRDHVGFEASIDSAEALMFLKRHRSDVFEGQTNLLYDYLEEELRTPFWAWLKSARSDLPREFS